MGEEENCVYIENKFEKIKFEKAKLVDSPSGSIVDSGRGVAAAPCHKPRLET